MYAAAHAAGAFNLAAELAPLPRKRKAGRKIAPKKGLERQPDDR